MHTHFLSGTHMLATTLEVLIGFSFLRLFWGTVGKNFPQARPLVRAAFFQMG